MQGWFKSQPFMSRDHYEVEVATTVFNKMVSAYQEPLELIMDFVCLMAMQNDIMLSCYHVIERERLSVRSNICSQEVRPRVIDRRSQVTRRSSHCHAKGR